MRPRFNLLAILAVFLGVLETQASPILRHAALPRDDHPLAAQPPSALKADIFLYSLLSIHRAEPTDPRAGKGVPEDESRKQVALLVSHWVIEGWEPDGSNSVKYFYHNGQVIAIGQQTQDPTGGPIGDIRWTHAIGRGPFGPCFIKDVWGAGPDYWIFTDHLGTPFAYENVDTGEVFYTPFSPQGELLATSPNRGPPFLHGNVPTNGFDLPPIQGFDVTPLGLAGHIFDESTGWTYMIARSYHPRLGHFLTADFRAPNLLDPSTFTEPYSYARGNPVFWVDMNGLWPGLREAKQWLAEKRRDLQLMIDALVFARRYTDTSTAVYGLAASKGVLGVGEDAVGAANSAMNFAGTGACILLEDKEGMQALNEAGVLQEVEETVFTVKSTVDQVRSAIEYFQQRPDEAIANVTDAVGSATEEGLVFSAGLVAGDLEKEAVFIEYGTMLALGMIGGESGNALKGLRSLDEAEDLFVFFVRESGDDIARTAGSQRVIASNTGPITDPNRLLPGGNRPRLARDVAMDTRPTPAAKSWQGRRIGKSPQQHQVLQQDIQAVRAQGAKDIRVNQQQVNASGQRVGINRPDLQYTLHGKRYYIEYDNMTPGSFPNTPRGLNHLERISANDPLGAIILRTF